MKRLKEAEKRIEVTGIMVEPGLGTKVLFAEVYNKLFICSCLKLKTCYRGLRAVICHADCYLWIDANISSTRRDMSSVTSASTLLPSRALNQNSKIGNPSHWASMLSVSPSH